jgi:hypothetical protein
MGEIQSFPHWKQVPIQTAMPQVIFTEQERLEQVEVSLQKALPWLENARELMQSNRLDERYSQLFEWVTDALQAVTEAVDHTGEVPDE